MDTLDHDMFGDGLHHNPRVGDRVRFDPFPMFKGAKMTPVIGEVVEVINGGAGLHILAPLPGDPCRVVRVFLDQGVLI